MGMLIFPQFTFFYVSESLTSLELWGYRPVLRPEKAHRAPLELTFDVLVCGSDGFSFMKAI